MAVTYEKTFEIEIINELSASVYNRVLNYVLNHELDTKNTRLLEVNRFCCKVLNLLSNKVE